MRPPASRSHCALGCAGAKLCGVLATQRGATRTVTLTLAVTLTLSLSLSLALALTLNLTRCRSKRSLEEMKAEMEVMAPALLP